MNKEPALFESQARSRQQMPSPKPQLSVPGRLIERIRGSIISMELCCFLGHLPELPVEGRLADTEQPGRF